MEYFEFRKRVAHKFDVNFHEILITGSAKLGFSPWKEKLFDLDSDIDVTIVSTVLFDRMMSYISKYQLELRNKRKSVTEKEIEGYHRFLEYVAMGWVRPDLLPSSFQVIDLRRDWFDFFQSISHGRSEVGNYKVSGGIFKSYAHIENYTVESYKNIKKRLQVRMLL